LENLADELDEEWTLMTAEARQQEESSRAPTVWEWMDIWHEEDLKGALFVAINPRLACYDAETGFQLGTPGDPEWQSPPRRRAGRRKSFPPYQRETYEEHVERMLRAYEHPFYDRGEDRQCLALEEELAYAARQLESRHGWPDRVLDRLARLIIALHDFGKLSQRWQAWAHRWQEEVSKIRGEELAIPADYMAAHTDYDEEDEEEKALSRELGRMKPNHAVESAQAVEDLLWDRAGKVALVRAALSAIARHHSAGARGNYGTFAAHPAAERVLGTVVPAFDSQKLAWSFQEGTLARKLMRPERETELLPYLLLVRVVRLADQRSQDKARW
jgi:hypothetical protein